MSIAPQKLHPHVDTAFLANISHEMRTPLNGIIGMASLLRQSEQNNEQLWYTDMILRAGNSLLGIIDNLLEYSKLEAGILVPDPKPIDLRIEIFECIESASVQASQKDIIFAVSIDPQLPKTITLDPNHVKQIINILLDNAIKFTEEGSISLSVTGYPTSHQCTGLSLCVSDTGVGIASEFQSTIFDKFTQEDTSMTRRFGGTGIGLALCKQLVNLYDGSITVQSEKDKGSTFTVLLPLQNTQNFTPLLYTRSFKPTVLIISDKNSPCAKTASDYCTFWNIPIRHTHNILALTNHKKFDITILCSSLINTEEMPDFAQLRSITSSKHLAIIAHQRHYSLWSEHAKKASVHLVKAPMSPHALLFLLENECALEAAFKNIDTPISTAEPSSPKTSYIRILVAEDNEINQIFVRKALLQYGHTVTIAQNGKEAVDLHASGYFDLILMDVQMPIMDGLSATRAIRLHEKETHRRIPILALTASTAVKDWDECFFAGMDGFLSKPISADELHKRIQPFLCPALPPQPLPNNPQTHIVNEYAHTAALSEQSYTSALAALGNDKELFTELIEVITTRWPTLITTLETSYSSHNTQSIGNILHTIKGSISVFGSESFVPLITEYMNLARAGTPKSFDEVILIMEKELVHLKLLALANKPS